METMKKVGILLHVYHLETSDWERLVWGDSSKDELGTVTKFAECLLDIPFDKSVVPIVYSGPSQKDGLTEGAYTRHYLLKHSERLIDFFRLKQKVDKLSQADYKQFLQRLHALETGPVIKNTMDEVVHAGAYFKSKGVNKVIQVAATSHAPRCMQSQALARQRGLIDKNQQWCMVASETCFKDTTPDDVVIVEPPHRGDDALAHVRPSLSEVLRPYFSLSLEKKKLCIQKLNETMSDLISR